MIINAITYLCDDEQPMDAPLDARRQIVHCPDVQVSRNFSRELGVGMARVEAAGAPEGVRESLMLPGYGTVYATLSSPESSVNNNAERLLFDDQEMEGARKARRPLPGALRHVSMDDVFETQETGDTNGIARKILSLIDTGTIEYDFASAIDRLERYAASLGRDGRADTPLARIQAIKTQLEQEWFDIERARENAKVLAADARLCRERLLQLEKHRERLQGLLRATVTACAKVRLTRLQELKEKVDAFQEGPRLAAGDAAAIKRKETLVETARLQCERTSAEIEQTKTDLGQAQAEGAPTEEFISTATDIPEAFQRDIQACLKAITELSARYDEVNNQMEDLDRQINQTQDKMAALPDFTRIAPNPVDWLNQLSSSLKTAISVRYEEEDLRDKLWREINELRVVNAGGAHLFSGINDFAAAMEEHETRKKTIESKRAEIEKRVHENRGLRDDFQERIPGLMTLGAGCMLFLIFILGVFATHQKTPYLYPAGILGLAVLWFLFQFMRTRRNVLHLAQAIAEDHAELDLLDEEEKGNTSVVDKLMVRAGCANVRELGARYDEYSGNAAKLRTLEEQLRVQEQGLRESEERIPKLFKRVCETLMQVDEHPESTDEVERCVGSAIGKYRVYQDTVRRLADLRNRQQGLVNRRRFQEKELAGRREQLARMEQKLREVMRENGFYDESAYTEINALLTDYYRYLDTARETTSRREVLSRRLRVLESRLQEEEALLARYEDELRALLSETGLDNMEEVNFAAENASLCEDWEREFQQVEGELESLLQGHDLAHWEDGAAAGPDVEPGNTLESCEQVREELTQNVESYEKAHREYQLLREERRQLFAGRRSQNEVEEDLALLNAREQACRRRLSVVARAAAMMEELARVWRNRQAAAIANKAEWFLGNLGILGKVNLKLDDGNNPELEATSAGEAAIPIGTLHLVLHLAAIEELGPFEKPGAVLVDGTLQQRITPFAPQKLFAALESIAARRQVIVISEDPAFTLAGIDAGWSALAL